MPVNPIVGKIFSRSHVFLYRRTGGRFGSSMRGVPIVLLTTTGRKSGQRRTTPLQSIDDGENIVVIASNSGHKVHPQWWLNLKVNPDATVRIKRRQRKVHAEEATGEERASLWQKAVDQYADYANYQKTAEREIPVVVLKPV